MSSLAYIHLEVGEKGKKLIDARGLIFKKTIFAPTITAHLAIIWLSPIPVCYVSGADIAALEVYNSKRSMSSSDLQISRSALFLLVSLYFYLVTHLKSRDGGRSSSVVAGLPEMFCR